MKLPHRDIMSTFCFEVHFGMHIVTVTFHIGSVFWGLEERTSFCIMVMLPLFVLKIALLFDTILQR